MGERGVAARHLRSHHAILGHHLRAKGLFAEMQVTGRYSGDRLNDLPLFVFFGHRALEYFAVARLEPAHAPGCTKRIEVMAACRRRRA